MKTFTRIIGGLALLGVGLAGGLFVLHRTERIQSHFPTHAALASAGLIAQGWLPAFLPESIRDISESHDLDTNRVRARFRYDPQDTGGIEAHCRLLFSSAEGRKFVCPPFNKGTTVLILKRDGWAWLESVPDGG